MRLVTWRIGVTLAAFAASLFGLMAPSRAVAVDAVPIDLRFGARADGARVVIDSARKLAPQVREDSTPGAIVLALDAPVKAARPRGDGIGAVKSYDIQSAAAAATITLRLAEGARLGAHFALDPAGPGQPFRYVIDVKADAAPNPQAVSAGEASQPASLVEKRRHIVIDPGHGGEDPGARGRNGAKEKDVTLAAARALESILTARGYDVSLTRTGDSLPSLDARVEFARSRRADLFISLHADSGANPNLRGAAVYSLSTTGFDRARRIGDEHNWAVSVDEAEELADPVNRVLRDLALNESVSRSRQFAKLLVPELEKAGALLRRTHRAAEFYVLLTPEPPAVLLEMGFITNADDERQLTNPAEQKKRMTAVARAIDAYFDGLSNNFAQR